jgi:hypothetical protein
VSLRGRAFGVLALGALCIVVAMAAGRSDALARLLEPPVPVRFLLGAAAASFGVWLVFRSADRLASSREPRALIRAVRLVFLAVAAFAAAAGWFLGSPVPVVAALLIAGVDVIETTFLLLVTARTERG